MQQNTSYNIIKIRPVDVESGAYNDYGAGHNDKDPKFKVSNHVRISKDTNNYGKDYTPNASEKVLLVKEIKNNVPWTYAISDLNHEEIIGKCYEKEFQKTIQTEFRVEKVMKRTDQHPKISTTNGILIGCVYFAPLKFSSDGSNCLSDGRAMIIHSIAGLI